MLGRDQPDVESHVRPSERVCGVSPTAPSVSSLQQRRGPRTISETTHTPTHSELCYYSYPNPADPLNGDAAALMMKDKQAYEAKCLE